ncbi:MAG: magnesium and cobalt transport protein CorA, partial [Crenarchaeota archaeon]|nr:magnesium and cobalt transport protein CorA [Thermoproteota archaeon]
MKGRAKKAGLPPGSIVYVGSTEAEKTTLNLINYSENKFESKEITNIEELDTLKDNMGLLWVNVDGLEKTDVIEKIGKNFML